MCYDLRWILLYELVTYRMRMLSYSRPRLYEDRFRVASPTRSTGIAQHSILAAFTRKEFMFFRDDTHMRSQDL